MVSWVIWLLSAALIGLSFWFLKKGEPTRAFFGVLLGFVIFIGAVVENALPVPTLEQIFCGVFALTGLALSFWFLKKEKHAEALTVFFIAFGMGLCGLSAVQGLLKTGILSKVNHSLVDYSKKLDGFQTDIENDRKEFVTNLADARKDFSNEIANAQMRIDRQQATISNQYDRITILQSNLNETQQRLKMQMQTNADLQTALAKAQERIDTEGGNIRSQVQSIASLQNDLTNTQMSLAKQIETNLSFQNELNSAQHKLQEQQAQIRDVKSLVNDMFARKREETINGTDTNNVVFYRRPDQSVMVLFKLQTNAVENSVQIVKLAFSLQMPLVSVSRFRNIAFCVFGSGTSIESLKSQLYSLSYVIDTWESSPPVKTMAVKDNMLYIDGTAIGLEKRP